MLRCNFYIVNQKHGDVGDKGHGVMTCCVSFIRLSDLCYRKNYEEMYSRDY